jgi:hypothetical protein
VEAADSTWRIHDDEDGLLAEDARTTTTKPIARFKVHNLNHHASASDKIVSNS